ncbi:Gldg family protein [Patescibacteria group bacterium]|nr:Gldg family protein [Patescibacteria group bacterium]
MNKKNILTIIKKELSAYFNNPTAYVIVAAFLFMAEFLFFKQAFLIGQSSLQSLFFLLPWLFLLFIPAITMGSISQEKNQSTLEFLLTKPLKEIDLIIGKLLSSLIFVTISLSFFIPIAASFSTLGNFDWGAFVTQYLAAVFLAGVLISLGIFVSSYFDNQISSFLISAISSFFIIIIGFDIITASLPYWLANITGELSVLTHFTSMSRGVIDFRDVWYFISFVSLFSALAYLRLMKNKYSNQAKRYRTYKTGILLFIGIVIFTNIIGARLPGRIDLTQDKIFTLTTTTKNTLKDLDDIVNITLYVSKDLPARVKPVMNEIKYTLNDYKKLAKGNIQVDLKNPTVNPAVVNEMRSYGVNEMQFNVIEQEELKIKKGTLGIVVSYGSKYETIPFVQDTRDLEYNLTKFITKLTNKNKKKIVFFDGYGSKKIEDFSLIRQELEQQFEVSSFEINLETPEVPSNTNLLIIPGVSEQIDESVLQGLDNYVKNKGAIMVLLDGVFINPQAQQINKNETNLILWLKDNYGITLNNDLVYDLQSNEMVSFGGGFFSYSLPYPLWVRGLPLDNIPITNRISNIVLPWTSSLKVNETKALEQGFNPMVLFTTSQSAGSIKENYNIAPDQTFPKDNLAKQDLIIALEPKQLKSNLGRIIVVPDSDFLSNAHIQGSIQNSAFALESSSWLSQEISLAGIKIKQKNNNKLLFQNQNQPKLIKYINLSISIIIPFIIGFTYLLKRRNKQQLTYLS